MTQREEAIMSTAASQHRHEGPHHEGPHTVGVPSGERHHEGHSHYEHHHGGHHSEHHHEGHHHKPKFFVNIEGREYPWDRETISVPEIRNLGSMPPDTAVLEINLEDNTERTLGNAEVVHIKPGHGFAKKVRYQRG